MRIPLFFAIACAVVIGASADTSISTPITGTSMAIIRSSSYGYYGLAIGAPHEGFDSRTSDIVRGIDSSIRCGRVYANGFRKRSRNRFINVNRPTEEPYSSGRFLSERQTSRAQDIYNRYQNALLRSAWRYSTLDLLVEIHGNSRKINVRGKEVPFDVIECATTGFSATELRELHKVYETYRTRYGLPKMYFQGIPEHYYYYYQGTLARFYYRASGAKSDGALRSSRARRVLHFELPRSVRFSYTKRGQVTTAISEIIDKAWKTARSY